MSTGSPVALPELLQRANEAYAAGDDKQAIIDYSLFILLNPTFSQAYYNRALSYEATGDLNQAIQDLGRALSYFLAHVLSGRPVDYVFILRTLVLNLRIIFE